MLITGISVAQGLLQSKGEKNRELITFVFSCSADNDLCRAVVANGYSCSRYNSPAEAVEAAMTSSVCLFSRMLSPGRQTISSRRFLKSCKKEHKALH